MMHILCCPGWYLGCEVYVSDLIHECYACLHNGSWRHLCRLHQWVVWRIDDDPHNALVCFLVILYTYMLILNSRRIALEQIYTALVLPEELGWNRNSLDLYIYIIALCFEVLASVSHRNYTQMHTHREKGKYMLDL